MLKNKLVPMAVVAVSLLSAGLANAGARYAYSVTVDNTNHRAYGSAGTARNSADSNMLLACSVQAGTSLSGVVSAPVATCSAVDAAGTYGSCSTSEATFVDAVKTSFTGDSYVLFGWNAAGTCNGITIYNGSYFEPKK